MRYVKILVLTLGVLILIAGVGVAILVSQFNPDDYRGRIAESITKATGRDVQLRGSIGITFGLTPVVTVADFTLGNMAGGSRPEMLKAAKLEVSVAILPLLTERRIDVKRLAVDGVDLLLERLADGRANWQFTPVTEPPAGSAPRASATSQAGPLPSIDSLVMTKTTIIWRDGTKPARNLTLERLEAGLPRDGGLSLSANGILDGVALSSEAKLASVSALIAGKDPVPGKMTVKLAGASLEIDGRFGPGAGFDGKITAAAPALASLLALAGQQGPEPGALGLTALIKASPAGLTIGDGSLTVGEGGDRVSAKLSGKVGADGLLDLAISAESQNTKLFQRFGATLPEGAFSARASINGTVPVVAIEGLDLKIGEMRAQGRIAVERLMPTPKISIDLGVDRILLAKPATTAAPAAKAPATAAAGDGRVIPALPLPWDSFNKLDATAAIRIGTLISDEITLQALTLRAGMVAGTLSLNGLEFGFAGGQWVIKGTAKSTDNTLGLTLDADGVDTVLLAKAFGASPAVASKLKLDVDFAGQGADLRSVMASSHGQIMLDAAGGIVSTSQFKGMASSLVRILLAGRADEDVRLECAVIHLPIEKGIGRLARTAVETQKLGMTAGGTINFGTEKLALRVDPTTRDQTLQMLAPAVLIGGALGAPEVNADRAGVATGAISALSALATGRNPLAGGAAPPSAAENCAAARSGNAPVPASTPAPAAAPGQIMPDTARPGATAPALPDAIKGLFEGLRRR